MDENGFEEAYRKLESKLLLSRGKQVLFAENKLFPRGCGGVNKQVIKTLELGILEDFEKYENFGIILSMKNHVRKIENKSEWELVYKNIEVSDFKIINLGKEIRTPLSRVGCFSGSSYISEPALHFAFGEDVENYFMVGSPLQFNGSDIERGENPKRDASYFDALRLLEIKIPVRLQTLSESLEESKMDFEKTREKYT